MHLKKFINQEIIQKKSQFKKMRKNFNTNISIEQNSNINNCKVERMRNYLYVNHINFIFRKLYLI